MCLFFKGIVYSFIGIIIEVGLCMLCTSRAINNSIKLQRNKNPW